MATNKVICDTDVIIDYWDNKKVRHTVTKHVIDDVIGTSNVWISAITQIELLIGAFDKSELLKISKALNRFSIITINDAVTNNAVKLIKEYTLSHGLALPDALIASTSLQSGIELFTYNLKDYKFIEGIKLFDFQKNQTENI